MKEANFITKFRKKFIEQYPDAFWYKIPDGSPGIKPYDVVAQCNSISLAIEFKVYPNTVTDHQRFFLAKFARNGGIACVITLRGKNIEISYLKEKCNLFDLMIEKWR